MDMSPREVSSSLFCYLEKVVETQCLNILRMSLCRRELGGQQTVSGGPGEGLPRLLAGPAVARPCHLLRYLIECALNAYSMPHTVMGFSSFFFFFTESLFKNSP